MARQPRPFQAASSGSNGAFWLARVKPAAQPRDGLAIATAVRLALAPAAMAGPGTVRHPPVAAPAVAAVAVAAVADEAVNAVTLMATATAVPPTRAAGRHER